MEIFRQNRIFNFVFWSKYGLFASFFLVCASLYLIFGIGFTLGIDFAGGSSAQLQYSANNAPMTQIRQLLESDPHFKNAQVSKFGADNEILIKIPFHEDLKTNEIDLHLYSLLGPSGEFNIRKLDTVGPKVGDELKKSAILSLSLALIAMMLYVSFRYEWRFALAAIFALAHDVLITAASVIVFNIDLNLEVIAALLTLLGYSINDTIIIFDRIREKMLEGKKMNVEEVINEAISNTLTRTTLTSLTMLFVVFTLYLFGGQIIIGFSLPLLVGVVLGTYSSIFIAPKLAIVFKFSIENYYAKEVQRIKRQEEKKRMRQLYENGRV